MAVPAVTRVQTASGCGTGGRKEAPTEPQFRSIERQTSCYDNETLRRTLAASFLLARKTKVPFADLIYQQIKEARESVDNGHRLAPPPPLLMCRVRKYS